MTTDGNGTLSLRLPPQNIDAEQWVLGAILLNGDIVADVLPMLDISDFWRDAHQAVYAEMIAMSEAGLPIDIVILAERLRKTGQLDVVGGNEFLADLANSVPHSANARYHAEIVRQKADMRRAIVSAEEVLKLAYSNNHTSEDVVAQAQSLFLAIGDRSAPGETTLFDAVTAAMKTLDRRWRGEDPGVRLPWRKLDLILDGLRPGRLYVVGGRPGNGKSALLFNLADHAAMTGYGGGIPVLFFALEMGSEELAERYLSARAGIDGYAFKRPHELLKGEDLTRIRKAHEAAKDSRLILDDSPDLTVSQVRSRARRHKHRHGLGLVLVDYLQLVSGQKSKGENRQEEIARISRGLAMMAKELNIPVVAASQLNRGVEGRTGAEARPRLSDLRESGQIEQDAHGVLLLHRPEMIDKHDRPGIVEVIVAKHRGGITGRVDLAFVRNESRFEDLPEIIPDEGNAPDDF